MRDRPARPGLLAVNIPFQSFFDGRGRVKETLALETLLRSKGLPGEGRLIVSGREACGPLSWPSFCARSAWRPPIATRLSGRGAPTTPCPSPDPSTDGRLRTGSRLTRRRTQAFAHSVSPQIWRFVRSSQSAVPRHAIRRRRRAHRVTGRTELRVAGRVGAGRILDTPVGAISASKSKQPTTELEYSNGVTVA